MECPNCGTDMEKVEGAISPARQEAGGIVDEEWGEWMECPDCGQQEDIE